MRPKLFSNIGKGIAYGGMVISQAMLVTGKSGMELCQSMMRKASNNDENKRVRVNIPHKHNIDSAKNGNTMDRNDCNMAEKKSSLDIKVFTKDDNKRTTGGKSYEQHTQDESDFLTSGDYLKDITLDIVRKDKRYDFSTKLLWLCQVDGINGGVPMENIDNYEMLLDRFKIALVSGPVAVFERDLMGIGLLRKHTGEIEFTTSDFGERANEWQRGNGLLEANIELYIGDAREKPFSAVGRIVLPMQTENIYALGELLADGRILKHVMFAGIFAEAAMTIDACGVMDDQEDGGIIVAGFDGDGSMDPWTKKGLNERFMMACDYYGVDIHAEDDIEAVLRQLHRTIGFVAKMKDMTGLSVEEIWNLFDYCKYFDLAPFESEKFNKIMEI